MQPNEIRATLAIGGIFVARMLGVFMIFPVLALYANHFTDANMTRIGLALGAYGLLQALLQLPMAALSDKYGRKRIIMAGLGVFALGSVIAAFATSLNGIIVGRAIQGAGAIGATLLATVADQTRPIVRTRAMAIIGILIGTAFTLSVVIGPILDAHFGLRGLFLSTALLAVLGMTSLSSLSNTRAYTTSVTLTPRTIFEALTMPNIWRLYLSVFILHAVLTTSFLVVPMKIQTLLALDKSHSWQFYIPILIGSLACVAPWLRRADEDNRQKTAMILAVLGLFAILPLWFWTEQPVFFVILSILFFAGFNYLEASIPASVSQLAPKERRGMILGMYSSAQFLGLFIGGSVGGFCWGHWQLAGALTLCSGLLFVWLMVIAPFCLASTPLATRQNI